MYRKTLPCSKHSAVWNFFYNLTLSFQLFTITTWFVTAPNINQPTFGEFGIDQMELYGLMIYFGLQQCIKIFDRNHLFIRTEHVSTFSSRFVNG